MVLRQLCLQHALSWCGTNGSRPALCRLLLLRPLFGGWSELLIHLIYHFNLLVGDLTLISEAVIYYEGRFVHIQVMPWRKLCAWGILTLG